MNFKNIKYVVVFFLLLFLSNDVNAQCGIYLDKKYGTLNYSTRVKSESGMEPYIQAYAAAYNFFGTTWVNEETKTGYIFNSPYVTASWDPTFNQWMDAYGPNYFNSGTCYETWYPGGSGYPGGPDGCQHYVEPGGTYHLILAEGFSTGGMIYLKNKKITDYKFGYLDSKAADLVIDRLFGEGFKTIDDSGRPVDRYSAATINDIMTKILRYSVLGSNINTLNVTYSEISATFFSDYYATLKTPFENSAGPANEPADGMGLNVKPEAWGCDPETYASTYYTPHYIMFTYSDTCDPVAAGTIDVTSGSKFRDYWDISGRSSRRRFTPTEQMMYCTCTTDVYGKYLYPSFNKFINNKSGGSRVPLVRVTANNLTVSCEVFNSPNECTFENWENGTLSEKEIEYCCETGAEGFTERMCPQDTTFDLFCDTNLTDTKTYYSPYNEVEKDNQACTIYCEEEGTPIFKESPYVIAGQWFNYDWQFNSKRTCMAEYKYAPRDWVLTYNDYVDDRVTAYDVWQDYRAKCTSTEPRQFTRHHKDGSTSTYTVIYCVPGGMKRSSWRSKERKLHNAFDDAYDIEKDFLDDKNTCDNWVNKYTLGGKFSMQIREHSIKTYTMDEKKNTLYENRVIEDTDYIIGRILSCSKTARSCNNYISANVYSILTKQTYYNYVYSFPDHMYIDRLTYKVSTHRTDDYYDGGFNYFTNLGTLTGQYPIIIRQNNSGFGAYKQWKLKNNEMICWYDLENKLGPPDDDDNYPVYGGIGLQFRIVTLTDLFPNGRSPGYNWKDETELIYKIEDKGQKIYTGKARYTIVLDNTSMKNIKSYVSKHEYSEWYDFEFSSSGTEGTSGFLDKVESYGADFSRSTATSVYSK